MAKKTEGTAVTVQELPTTLDELKALLEDECQAYTKAYTEKDFEAMVTLQTRIDELEKACKAKAKSDCYAALRQDKNPMRAAILQYSYTTFKHYDQAKTERQPFDRYVVPKKVQIDLQDFDRECGGIVADKNCWHMINELGIRLALRAAKGVNALTDKVVFEQSLATGEASFFAANPLSNTQIIKSFNAVLAAIAGKELGKATMEDVNYILNCATKRGNKLLTIDVIKNKILSMVFADVLHRIATKAAYSVELKGNKAKKENA